MHTGHRVVLYAALAVAVALTGSASFAQHITGTPGTPSATTTLDGAPIPAPPPKFGGTIERDALQSTPYGSPRIAPHQDAPNVLLIINAGYGVPSTYGRRAPCVRGWGCTPWLGELRSPLRPCSGTSAFALPEL